jgi:hypothetical protein
LKVGNEPAVFYVLQVRERNQETGGEEQGARQEAVPLLLVQEEEVLPGVVGREQEQQRQAVAEVEQGGQVSML